MDEHIEKKVDCNCEIDSYCDCYYQEDHNELAALSEEDNSIEGIIDENRSVSYASTLPRHRNW